MSVKVTKIKKGLDFFDCVWARPFGDSDKFGRVHMDLAFRDDDAKVFNGSFIEKILFRFKGEVILKKVS